MSKAALPRSATHGPPAGRRVPCAVAALALSLGAATAFAQVAAIPRVTATAQETATAQVAAFAHATTPEDTTIAQSSGSRRLRPFADLRLRGDWLDRPANDLSRAHGSLRGGFRLRLRQSFDLVLAGRANAGSGDAELGTDNEERTALSVDRAALEWFTPHEGTLRAGKAPLALALSSLVWDDDLRPIGVSYRLQLPVRSFDSVEIAAAVFAPSDRLGDQTRAAGMMARWLVREGAATGGGVGVGFLRFEHTDALAASPYRRTNRARGGRFASDYELVIGELFLRLPAGAASVLLRGDAVLNLGASADARAERLTVSYRRAGAGRLETALVAQRIARDAVLAAYNSDDWWFHSAARGVAVFVGRELAAGVTVRGSYFRERRDDLAQPFDRVVLDFTGAW